ncbi:MAG: HemX protein, negative effector of steady-state concentration of glutamyl-tRNA reductase [Ignavibacteriae bacterium]|nr:MAG: HemX protein, negative effector of steady-state concentration of glutamyl-tRNA reductase [Ignavibacteriota bacterium]
MNILNIALPILYILALSFYGISFFKESVKSEKFKKYLLSLTVLIHLLYLVLRTINFSHPPITNVFEILTVISFSLAVAYLFIEIKTKVRSTGFFILIVVVVFQILSSLFIKDLLNVPEVLRSNLLGFHVVSALLGFSAITISAVYGLLYLMLYHEIKTTRFGTIYQRLPNLEILEQMSFTATVFGFVFLTIAIIIGAIWLPKAFENFSYTDPKLIGTTFIWLLYALGLIANKFVHWRGKKIIWLSIIGFIISFFSMTIINMFFSNFHRFY